MSPQYSVANGVYTHSNRLVSNKVWRLKSSGPTKPVEWAYCFDVHLNAFFPLALYIYAIQMLCWPCMGFTSHNYFCVKWNPFPPQNSLFSASHTQYSQCDGHQLHLAIGCLLLYLHYISWLHRYTHIHISHLQICIRSWCNHLLFSSFACYAQHHDLTLCCSPSDVSLCHLHSPQVERCSGVQSLLPLEGYCPVVAITKRENFFFFCFL